jgi:RNA polymerase sigma-70 factor, ECF subfamily
MSVYGVGAKPTMDTSKPAPAAAAWRPTPIDSTVDLVDRVQKGDLAAREVLLARHMRALKPIVHHRLPMYVRSMTDTDDVVQEVLVKTVGRLEHFESRNPMAFLAYLRRAVVNRIVDEVRRHVRACPTVPLTHDCVEPAASPLERLLGKEHAGQCRRALARLRPRDRQVILLRVSESLSYAEIANRLGMPTADAARVALSRALSRLTVALKHVRAASE